MVSPQLGKLQMLDEIVEGIQVKTEPEDCADVSHLLSQVEVKIKTEPVDEY